MSVQVQLNESAALITQLQQELNASRMQNANDIQLAYKTLIERSQNQMVGCQNVANDLKQYFEGKAREPGVNKQLLESRIERYKESIDGLQKIATKITEAA